MKLSYVKGDLLSTDIKHIVHGCNNRGVMGSGVAKAIRSKYPSAFTDYQDYFLDGKKPELGSLIFSFQDDDKVIINAITQQNYGRDPSTVYVSYWAVADAFRRIEIRGLGKIALPMIGAGLANGDWNVISAIISNTLVKTQATVYIL